MGDRMTFDRRLLPVKLHYFFFMAASGPILPYLTVYGKELGIAEVVMGSITAVLPVAFLLAKPFFGFLADRFVRRRKTIFMLLITAMSVFYVSLYFVPPARLVHGARCNESSSSSSAAAAAAAAAADECDRDLYSSLPFLGFVIFMSLSMITYNVANSISDAICFDILGEERQSEYGKQRVWGAVGFGVAALLGGFAMDFYSEEDVKNYVPAFVMVAAFTLVDLFCCTKLKLPKMMSSESILRDVADLLQHRRIVVFLAFTVLAGVLDSFIIYFLFWFLEDLAEESGERSNVKMLEGLTVAAETLGGEIVFFPLSGKIVDKLGYQTSFAVCFFNYAARLALISIIPGPWWILPVELFMQGPTYAFTYTVIVAYANAVSPPGTSATMQGLVAGMDDGLGYAVGSLLGGFLYKFAGGRSAFRYCSLLSLACCLAHFLVHRTFFRDARASEVPEKVPEAAKYAFDAEHEETSKL